MRRALLPAVLIAVGAGLLGTAYAHPGSSSADGRQGGKVRSGGIFRIAFAPPEQLDQIDPAISNTQAGWALLDLACARLMTYPDKPAPAALHAVPEVAAAEPAISRDGKTYTFTLRSGFRFSDGTPVRASAFARAISRILAPGVRSAGIQYVQDIVGAADVQAGRATVPSGVVARGNRLVVRFKHPLADFAARTTMPYFCAVPPTLPADPEGVTAFPGAGPYYVTEYRPGERVVLKRNRFYRGTRPHYVDGFEVDLQVDSPQELLDRIERDEADWGIALPPAYFDPARGLVAKYGVNKSQFFVKPGFTFRGFVLNTARPLFRDNVPLRQAVNFAIDRSAMRLAAGGDLTGRLTDQYVPPSLPGFSDAQIYPLQSPDLQKAQALARGNTRSGKAVLYVYDIPLTLAFAQILRENLAKIGLDVEIQAIPVPAYPSRVSAVDAPFDIAFFVTPSVDYYDPYAYLSLVFDGRFVGSTNWAHFDSPKYNRLLRSAALLRGEARYRAYGKLDVQLARDAAPTVAQSYVSEPTLVSKRVGCVLLRPTLDLTAACLK
jgi:peptide/nickel transport system substrate-binding protein